MKTISLPPACMLRLQAIYGSLKRAERSAADLLKTDPGFVADASIAEAAGRAGCSQPTFLRLARRLGFTGYAELKTALRSGVVPDVRSTHTQALLDMSGVLSESLRTGTQSLEDAWAVLDPAAFSLAVEALTGANRICFFGSGEAAAIAMAGEYRFCMSGVNTRFASDPDIQLGYISSLEEGDVCILISHTGDTRPAIQTARWVKERKATLVAITSYPYSPIGKIADILLATTASDADSAPMGGLPTLMILEALYKGLLSQKPQMDDALRQSHEGMRAGRALPTRTSRMEMLDEPLAAEA